MSKKSKRINKLNCEGKSFDFFTDKNDKGTLIVGFKAAEGKHVTIIHEEDGISSHLTKPNRVDSNSKAKHQRLIKILAGEARKKLSFEDLRIVNVDPAWELWHPKENIVSISYELTNQGKLPRTLIEAGKNHFDSLVQLSIENNCLDTLFNQITYEQILNKDYSFAYKVDKNGKASLVYGHSKTEAFETPLFSKETEDLLREILSVKDLMPE